MDCFLWAEASKDRNKLTEKYEPLQPFLFLSFLDFSNAEVVLDVGANVGLYSLVSTMANKVNAVYAFEPDEAAYQELIKNLTLNGIEKLVKPHQVAVSDSDGCVRFGSHTPMSGVNGVVSTSIHDIAIFSDTYDVRAISLDQLDDIQGKVLGIKIDVEGHELQVIDGACELLNGSPAFIQVEHYVGSGIDQKLSELGYFCFFTAGHDHYFTNIRNFRNPLFVKRAVEYAATWLIETHAGRWPNVNTIKNSLSLSCEVSNGLINANACLHYGFFSSDTEYAFYLMVDGVKADEQWYRSEPHASFQMPDEADSIEVKAFAREESLPEKKVVVGYDIKKPATGYRPGSAVEDSLSLPSQYAAVISRLDSELLDFSDIDLSPLLQAITDDESENIVQLGGDSTALTIAREVKKGHLRHLSVLCTAEQTFSLKQGRQRTGEEGQNFSQWVTLHSVLGAYEFEKTLASLAQGLQSATHVLLKGQFLADIGVTVAELSPLLAHLPEGSKLYTEGLSNASYRHELTELAGKHGIAVEWLYPRSTILPPERLSLAKNHIFTDSLTLSADASTEQAFGLSFSASSNAHPERALGLDFSLPEDRH